MDRRRYRGEGLSERGSRVGRDLGGERERGGGGWKGKDRRTYRGGVVSDRGSGEGRSLGAERGRGGGRYLGVWKRKRGDSIG